LTPTIANSSNSLPTVFIYISYKIEFSEILM
jgi:hypothetical protein